MNSYNMFLEREYCESKKRAMNSPRDNAWRKHAIHEFKKIYGSTLRKLIQINGKIGEKGIELDKVVNILPDDLPNYTYTIKYIRCFFEEFNDDFEYKHRKIEIKKWKNKAFRKHMHSYLHLGLKELRKYRNIYIDSKNEIKYDGMRRAMLIFNTILSVYYLRRTPKQISADFYLKCLKYDSNIQRVFILQGDKACMTKEKSISKKYQYIKKFNDDIRRLFILHFLKLDRR